MRANINIMKQQRGYCTGATDTWFFGFKLQWTWTTVTYSWIMQRDNDPRQPRYLKNRYFINHINDNRIIQTAFIGMSNRKEFSKCSTRKRRHSTRRAPPQNVIVCLPFDLDLTRSIDIYAPNLINASLNFSKVHSEQCTCTRQVWQNIIVRGIQWCYGVRLWPETVVEYRDQGNTCELDTWRYSEDHQRRWHSNRSKISPFTYKTSKKVTKSKRKTQLPYTLISSRHSKQCANIWK